MNKLKKLNFWKIAAVTIVAAVCFVAFLFEWNVANTADANKNIAAAADLYSFENGKMIASEGMTEDIIAANAKHQSEDIIATNAKHQSKDIIATNDKLYSEDVIAANAKHQSKDIIATNAKHQSKDIIATNDKLHSEDVIAANAKLYSDLRNSSNGSDGTGLNAGELPLPERSTPIIVRDNSKEFFNTTDGMVYNFYMPYDTKSMRVMVDSSVSEEKLLPKDSDYNYGNELSVWFQYTIKTSGNHTFYYYKTDDASDLIDPLTVSTMELRKWLDGVAPRAKKNSLNTVLKGNVWDVKFNVEEPSSGSGNFWAKSGIKSVSICKKERKDNDSPYEYIPIDGLKWVYPERKEVVEVAFSLTNEKGDYFAELTDVVGNKIYYGILSISERSEPYFEALSFASQYVNDENLNRDLRQDVEEALGVFLAALNVQEQGEPFLIKQRALDSAMFAVVKAKEAFARGEHRVVTVENAEYLPFGLTAVLDENSYNGKILIGDRLELRITIAKFLISDYHNDTVKSFIPFGTNNVLRFSAKLLLNGKEVPLKNPVSVYMGIPNHYSNIAMSLTADGSATRWEVQSGDEWLRFEIGQSGIYDLFFKLEGETNLNLLWLLVLLLPLSAAVVFIVLSAKKRKKKSDSDGTKSNSANLDAKDIINNAKAVADNRSDRVGAFDNKATLNADDIENNFKSTNANEAKGENQSVVRTAGEKQPIGSVRQGQTNGAKNAATPKNYPQNKKKSNKNKKKH